jgi:hypothetical protein
VRRLLFAATLTALTPAAARAQEDDPTVSVAVFVVGSGSLSSAHEATLLLTMEKALESDRRLVVIDRDRALAERAGKVPDDVISEARGLLESGEAMLRAKRAGPALVRLQAAESQLEQHLAWVSKNELARAQFLVGAAHAVLGNQPAAVAEFVKLQVWRPDFVVDTEVHPGAVIPLWEQAKAQTAKLAGGSIEIKSKPDRALAYVDGRFVGFTPTTAEGLLAGGHYVTLRKVGFVRQVVRVTASGKQQQEVKGTLQAVPGADDLGDQSRAVAAALGDSRGPGEISVIGAVLEADHLLFVRVPASGAAGKYEAFLYNVASRRRLAAATAEADPEKEIETTFADLGRALYAQVVFKPKPKPKKKAAGPRKDSVWSRWWLWTGLGVAAAVAIAVPITISVTGDSGPTCPGSAVCGEIILGD